MIKKESGNGAKKCMVKTGLFSSMIRDNMFLFFSNWVCLITLASLLALIYRDEPHSQIKLFRSVNLFAL